MPNEGKGNRNGREWQTNEQEEIKMGKKKNIKSRTCEQPTFVYIDKHSECRREYFLKTENGALKRKEICRLK